MSITKSEYLSGNPLPGEGWYSALLVDAQDIGTIETPWGPEYKVLLLFELDSKAGNGNRSIIGKRFTRSFSEIAELRNFLENWRAIKYTPSEVKHGVDLEDLIGIAATLYVAQNKNAEQTNATIEKIQPYKMSTVVSIISHLNPQAHTNTISEIISGEDLIMSIKYFG